MSSSTKVSAPPFPQSGRELIDSLFNGQGINSGLYGNATGSGPFAEFGGNVQGRSAGLVGSGLNFQQGILNGINPGQVGAGFNTGLQGLQRGVGGQGFAGGMLPSIEALNAQFQPTTNYQFQQGAADLREQAALTGNLNSTGALNNLTDYRAQLDNAQRGQVAGIYGNALSASIPAGIASQTQLTQAGLGLPGLVSQGVGLPSAQTGYGIASQERSFPIDAWAQIVGAANGGQPVVQQGGLNPYGQAAVGLGSAYLSSGALAGKCWVAEAIYGANDDRTWAARFYINLLAPRWASELYEKVGRQVAAQVRKHRILARALRPLFDWMGRQALKVTR